MPEDTKICNVCSQEKRLSGFYFRKENGGYRNNCKKCKPLFSRIELIEKAHAPTKVCKDCAVEKPSSQFGRAGKGGVWAQPYCKPCDAERKRIHTANNRDRIMADKKRYYEENKKLVSKEQKILSRIKCNQAIVEGAKKYNAGRRLSPEEKKIRKALSAKKHRENNKEKLRDTKRNYMKRVGNKKKSEWQQRMMSDINFRLTKNLRGRIYVALKRGIKSDTTINLLGCTIDLFKIYIEDQFIEGMCWGNMGQWHLDHKKPCAKFDLTKESEQKLCFHYSNIQPLWKIDNLRKGAFYQEKKLIA